MREEDGIPDFLRWTLTAINRVGFPIMAFCVMAWICFVSLDKLSKALADNTAVINLLRVSIEDHNKTLDGIARNISHRLTRMDDNR